MDDALPYQPPNSAQIVVIVVNYNTAALALQAVDSILACRHGERSVEVHLVDNASPDGDAKVLEREIDARAWHDRVKFYPEAWNHGFGQGNNIVLKALALRTPQPQHVFLLNPDARLANDAITRLADFLDSHPAAVAAGARIEKPGGIPVSSAFRFPGIVSTFSSALNFGPVSRILTRWSVPLAPDLPTSIVDWVSGAAVMLRLSAIQSIDFFDPDYFLYFEEVDLMRRLTKQGGQIWHVAEAKVVHIEGVSTNVRSGRDERWRRPSYWYDSWRRYFTKNHGRLVALTAASAWILGDFGNRLLSLLRRRSTSSPIKFYHDFWARTVRPLLGLRAKPYD